MWCSTSTLFVYLLLGAVDAQRFAFKTCPALRSDSVDFDCGYHGTNVSCEYEILPGTMANMTCKDWYKIPLSNKPGYTKLNCLDGGVWDRTSFNCIPECGIAVSSATATPTIPEYTPEMHRQPDVIHIVNGYDPKMYGESATIAHEYTRRMSGGFPWHVAIYQKSDTDNFEQICAGTLVSPDLVISVAHCFYNDPVRKVEDASRFAVAAGKYHRDYNATDDYAQKSTIKRISLPERYVGAIQNYAQDIALLRLDTRFTMTSFVMPVCIDWQNEYVEEHLRNGQLGTVMGWGYTAAEVPSPNLQAIDLPFVDFERCIDAAPRDFKAYVTADKFCAGYTNGSSVCNGDSGGGLCFEHQGTWVLRGVVSVSPVKDGLCDTDYYAAFTNVIPHMKLIRDATFETGLERGPKIVRGETCDHFHKECVLLEDARYDGILQYRNGSDKRNSAAGDCILPEQPMGGSFKLGSCKGQCNVASGTRVPTGSFLIYTCDDGYVCKGNNVSVCYDNAWLFPPTCINFLKVKYNMQCADPKNPKKNVKFSSLVGHFLTGATDREGGANERKKMLYFVPWLIKEPRRFSLIN